MKIYQLLTRGILSIRLHGL